LSARKKRLVGPKWPPEKAKAELSAQLTRLQQLKAKNFQEAGAAEEEWFNSTEKSLIRCFGSKSVNYSNFRSARSAGEYIPSVFGLLEETKLRIRLQAYEDTLKSFLSALAELDNSLGGSTLQRILVLISHSSNDKALAEALTDLLCSGLALPASQIRCSSVDGHRLSAGGILWIN
jgi:hypothetical protein